MASDEIADLTPTFTYDPHLEKELEDEFNDEDDEDDEDFEDEDLDVEDEVVKEDPLGEGV